MTSIVIDNDVSMSNFFGMLSRHAGLSATAGLSCCHQHYFHLFIICDALPNVHNFIDLLTAWKLGDF